MNKTIWINQEVLDWKVLNEGGSIVGKHMWLRSYEIWEHAKLLIESSGNEFILSDGILNLKRSLNHRLKKIEELYSLKKLDFPNRPKGYLELLEYYGLVRPYLMRLLLEVRNNIEHNDSLPPNIERCMEFLDVVWYFLKSTDSLIQLVKGSAIFEYFDNNGSKTQYGFTIDYDRKNHKDINVSGWFPDKTISFTPQINSFQVSCSVFEDFKDQEYHLDKLETDRWIVGQITQITSEKKVELFKTIITAI